MDTNGSNRHNLTNDPSRDEWQAWSPDGKYIAFVSNRDDNFETYLMDFEALISANLLLV